MADNASQTQDTHSVNNQTEQGWKQYHEGMASKITIQKLKEAMRTHDRAMLERSIDNCKTFGVSESNPDLKKATRTLKIMDTRDNLRQAVDEKDVKEIDKQVETITKGPFYKYLQLEVAEAEQMADLFERHARLQDSILDMDKRTMSEMCRYPSPPQVVKHLIQAVLLLLGEDEATTEQWKNCQKLCRPDGPHGLNRRIMQFEPTHVHPEIAARAQEILSQYELKTAQAVSAGAGTFYVWAMGVVDECKSQNNAQERSSSPVQPAEKNRQREIFGRPPTDQSGKEQPWKKFGYMKRHDKSHSTTSGTAKEPRPKAHSVSDRPAWQT